MMIVWRSQAEQDLQRIFDFILDHDPAAAHGVCDRIQRRVAQPSSHPYIGRPGRVAGTRELVIGGTPYIVAYRVADPQVIFWQCSTGRDFGPSRLTDPASGMTIAKLRLDQLLLDRGLTESRAKAQALILAGRVFAGERRLDKPGHTVPADLEVEVREPQSPYVSRGGLKLAHGLDHFAIDPAGLVSLDVGASTGGFTDVLLRRGAARVYAVDVGHGQLDWRLRNDPRVVVLEKTNARTLTREQVPEPVDLVVCDASFISLKVVLPAALELANATARLIALIKPQFEVGKGRVGKGGVVRDPALHEEVCADIHRWLEDEQGWAVVGLAPSPITGPKGNREFLLAARRRPTPP